MAFKDEFKKARLSVYLTQKGLAQELDIPVGSIKNWERGNYLPSASAWEKITKFFSPRIPFSQVKNEYLFEKTQRGKVEK